MLRVRLLRHSRWLSCSEVLSHLAHCKAPGQRLPGLVEPTHLAVFPVMEDTSQIAFWSCFFPFLSFPRGLHIVTVERPLEIQYEISLEEWWENNMPVLVFATNTVPTM